MAIKQKTTKAKLVEILRQQAHKLKEPHYYRIKEIEDCIQDAICNGQEIHGLKELHENIFQYLIGQGCFPDLETRPQDYVNMDYYTHNSFSQVKSFLIRHIAHKYREPFILEVAHHQSEIGKIEKLYSNIISTVNALTPAKAKQYIMELQLNIPVEAFVDDYIVTVLPDDPTLQEVRSQLRAQIGGPTSE